MRFPRVCAGVGISLVLTCSPAASACLEARKPDQAVEGRLLAVQISIPDYGLKEQAYLLRLAVPSCLDGSDEYDKVGNANRIHVYATDAAIRTRMRRLVGRRVRVRGEPFGAETAHHHAPIVMWVGAIEAPSRRP